MPLRHARAREVSRWDDLEGDVWFAFEVFWKPPGDDDEAQAGSVPWQTWGEYLVDYLRIRPQARAVTRSIHVRGPRRPFAEEALREHGRSL